jgi:hypothetical protein
MGSQGYPLQFSFNNSQPRFAQGEGSGAPADQRGNDMQQGFCNADFNGF